jgi:glycosyltransferase involved in cell wall biosynthesis
MPRVLVITPEFPPHTTGGLGTHLVALTTSLSERGWTIDVILPALRSLNEPGWPEASEPSTAHGARAHVVPPSDATRAMHPSSRRGKQAYAADIRAYALEVVASRDERIDVVHLHDWFLAPVATEIHERVGAPLVTTLHLLYNPAFPWCGYKLPAEIVAMEGSACLSSDRVIAVSSDMAALVRETYGVPAERVVAIHNGLDPASIELFGAERAATPSSTILFAGRVTRQKGVLPLVRSARLVLDAVPEARWIIAGPLGEPLLHRDLGPELTELIASDPRLGAAITVTGSLSRARLAELYRDAALAIVPSVYEPFGYAALEAMCASVPVVASSVGGLREIVDDGKTGLLVPTVATGGGSSERTPDVEALAAAQIALLRDPARARLMGSAGRVRALAEFPPGRMAEQTEAVYRAAMGGKA